MSLKSKENAFDELNFLLCEWINYIKALKLLSLLLFHLQLPGSSEQGFIANYRFPRSPEGGTVV
jgi:hypothetical protein